MRKWYSYDIRLRGAKFADGSPWTYRCRAPDAKAAKQTAGRYFQKHRTPMNQKPRSLTSLTSKMVAKRVME
jgi:hypothetical protein